MSDYLSTLAARSLRREPACEPRRAQMFELRTEAQGGETVEGAAVETPPTASTQAAGAAGINEHSAGALAESRAESVVSRENAHASSHPTTHIRQSEDVPNVSAHLSQVEHHGEPVLEATDTPVVRRAQTEALAGKPTPPATRGATVTPPASHLNAARAEELVDSPPPPVSSRRSSSNTERAATPAPALQAGALDEKGREETPAVTTEVRPLNAQPAATETRAAALTAPADYAAPVREMTAQASPTIEVSIGRIEVRAVTPPAPPQPSRQKSAPPRMSLDDYLRAQSGGRS